MKIELSDDQQTTLRLALLTEMSAAKVGAREARYRGDEDAELNCDDAYETASDLYDYLASFAFPRVSS